MPRTAMTRSDRKSAAPARRLRLFRERNAKLPAMQPTPGIKTHDLRTGYVSGQAIAGTGVLVFEGELLVPPRGPRQ